MNIHDVTVTPLTPFTDHRGWLTELFRQDDLQAQLHPVMSYVSCTRPGVSRGPHEHHDQTDIFIFITGHWWIKLWDSRASSPTRGTIMRFKLTNPTRVIVPPGVIHAYSNAHGWKTGLVINCPNSLYKGHGKQAPVDETRHEGNPHYPIKDIEYQHWWSQLTHAVTRHHPVICATL